MFYLMFAILRLLVFMVSSNASTVTKSPASAKAQIVEARLNNLLNNGGSFGGNVYVQGDHHVTGTLYGTGSTLAVGDVVHMPDPTYMSGNKLTINRGTPSVPGGGPLSYSASHDSSLGTCCQDIVTGLSNSGVFQ